MLCLAPLPAAAFDADSDFMFAAGLFKKQRWQYAADAFEGFLNQHPEHPRASLARLYLGLSLNSLEKYGPARTHFQTFITENPDSRNLADAQYGLGECSYYLKDYKPAVEQLSLYLKDHQGHNLNQWASLLLGKSYNALDDHANAERVLEPLIEQKPPIGILADALIALAGSKQAQNQTEPALDLFQQVVDLKSAAHTPRGLAGVASVHMAQKDYVKAAEIYDRVVTEFSGTPVAASSALNSGIAKFQSQDYAQALATLQDVPADSSASTMASLWKALCRRELGELDMAREELASAFAAAKDTPLAAEILFNRAQVEVLDQKKDVAAQMFMDLADRWPGNSRVAESLFNAAELKMDAGDLPMASRLMERLQKEHPELADDPELSLLQGRMLLNSGKTDEAILLLQKVADADASSERKTMQRNYHLIRALYKGERYEDAAAAYKKLQDRFEDPKWNAYFGAIALASRSCLELEQYDAAIQLADTFLKLEQNPAKAADALYGRAIANCQLKQFQQADADLAQLMKDFPDDPQTWATTLQSAEIAWQLKEYAAAARFFKLAVQRKSVPKLHLSALSGLAWCHYRLDEFDQAATVFRDIAETYPESDAAHESSFMRGVSLRDAGKKDEAAASFLATYEALEKTAQDSSAPNVDRYLLESGRNYARLKFAGEDTKAADAVWEKLAERFGDSEQLEGILDEWAYVNLQAGRYDRSDEIYRRLLDKFPNGKFAGQARLSLAESDMQANRLDNALAEFIEIAANEDYRAAEKEAALYHVVDIKAAKRQWEDVLKFGKEFAENYANSPLAPNVGLLYAEGLLDQQQPKEAKTTLTTLRAAVVDGQLKAEPWTERIWVVLAETALAEKRFTDIDPIAAELEQRNAESRFLFQMRDVQGRRWKTQPNPDFAKARDYFSSVVSDEVGKGTETAARCQFLIAETWLLEKNYQNAVKEYYRVYLNYAFDDWRARGLFQAAGCEVLLQRPEAATKSYKDLVKEFPGSELAEKAQAKLDQLPPGR